MISPKFNCQFKIQNSKVHDISAVQIVFKLGCRRTPWFVWLNNCTFLLFIRFVYFAALFSRFLFKDWITDLWDFPKRSSFKTRTRTSLKSAPDPKNGTCLLSTRAAQLFLSSAESFELVELLNQF